MSNFIGNTMIYVKKPYKIWDYGFSFYNLDNMISDAKMNSLIKSYFYDNSYAKKGYSPYFFAKSILESIDEETIDKWAEFADMYPDRLKSFLISLIEPSGINDLSDLFHKIPIETPPIISLSKETLADIHYYNINGDQGDFYNFPEEGMGLFTELAKVKPFDNDNLRKFSNLFGLPTGIDIFEQTASQDIEAIKEYNTLLYFGAAPITLIYMELTEFKNIFDAFIAVKTNNVNLASKINVRQDLIEELEKVRLNTRERSNLIKLLEEKYEDIRKSSKTTNEFELSKCRKGLLKKLNKKINFNTKIVETLDGEFLETTLYNNLFEISYNQIKESLINKSEIRQCEYCDHYFEPQHGKQRFCSPLPFRKRSSCENSYNQAKAKKKKENQ